MNKSVLILGRDHKIVEDQSMNAGFPSFLIWTLLVF